MKVLPITALPDNPLWEVEFAALNHGLVMAGAKVKLINKLTGISQRRAKLLYQALRSSAPPLGAVGRGDPKFFALANSQTSTAWSIQSAIFLACFERFGAITETKLHRGWHLLMAHRCYLQLTEPLRQSTAVARLDINQAWSLLTHCRFLEDPRAELQRHVCPECLVNYLVIRRKPLRDQPCPICSINSNSERLSELRTIPRRRKRSAQV